MKRLTAEWLAKARRDLGTASRELKVRGCPNADAVCFHSQQAAEKSMKALLIEAAKPFPKTHDLAYIANLLSNEGIHLDISGDALRFLTRAAVEFRYPGEDAEKKDAGVALEIARKVSRAVGARLRTRKPSRKKGS